jgi:hypothetical protein
VGPRTGLDNVEKILALSGLESRLPGRPNRSPMSMPTGLSHFNSAVGLETGYGLDDEGSEFESR